MSKKTIPRTAKQARDRYTRSFQVSLSCVSEAVWRTGPSPEADNPEWWSLFLKEPIPLQVPHGALKLWLRASQNFHTYKDDNRGEYRCKADRYAYHLLCEGSDREEQAEVFMWDWHRPKPKTPHLHIRGSHNELGILRKFHVPSGRVLFEEVLAFLVREMRVKPRRRGALKLLQKEIDSVKAVWTWA